MFKHQRGLLVIICLLALSLVLSGCSQTGGSNPAATTPAKEEINYPTKPITLLVWSAAGSPVDIMARQISKNGEKYFGQPIVVENKTGGDGAIAMQAALSKGADGYTLVANTRSMVTSLATSLEETLQPEQFIDVYKVQDDPYLIAVRTESPFKSLDEVIKEAKKNPGKLTMAGYGAESAQAVLGANWAAQAEVNIKWVPFNGGSEAVVAALGGNTDLVFTNISGVVSQIKANQLRILAISTEKRIDIVPDTPTFAELGYKDFVQSHWRGIMVKAGTPDEIVQKIYDCLSQATADADFVSYMKNGGLITPAVQSSKDFNAEVQNDVKNMKEALKK